VGKQASYETCYRLKDKALRGLVKLISLDDSYYMHDMVKEEKLEQRGARAQEGGARQVTS